MHISTRQFEFYCIETQHILICNYGNFRERSVPTVPDNKYHSFNEFYPVYLNEHSNQVCRELHFVGSTLALACFAALLLTENLWWLPAAMLCGYGFAWIGHF